MEKYKKLIISEIKKKNLKLKKFYFYLRSAESSTDKAPSELVLIEALKKIKKKYEFCCFIQATSPLLKSSDIIRAHNYFLKNNFDSLFSASNFKKFIWKKENSKNYIPINYNPKKRLMRQDISSFVKENGAFYFFKVPVFLKRKIRVFGKIGSHIMPEERSVEVDNIVDLKHVQNFFSNRFRNKKILFKKKIKAIFSDVDGVLTDGSIYYHLNYNKKKEPMIKFSVIDGHGIKLCKIKNIKFFAISSNDKYKKVIFKRLNQMGFDEIFFNVKNKLIILKKILKKYNLDIKSCIYLGDDTSDISVVKSNIISIAPNNAIDCIKKNANYILKSKGGNGFFREVCNLVLQNNNIKKKI